LIYPKITRDKILIKTPGDLKDRINMKLISISGIILLEKSIISDEFTVSLEEFNNGIYILLLSSKETIWKEKIIKTK
jgi:hypothetical protein